MKNFLFSSRISEVNALKFNSSLKNKPVNKGNGMTFDHPVTKAQTSIRIVNTGEKAPTWVEGGVPWMCERVSPPCNLIEG